MSNSNPMASVQAMSHLSCCQLPWSSHALHESPTTMPIPVEELAMKLLRLFERCGREVQH